MVYVRIITGVIVLIIWSYVWGNYCSNIGFKTGWRECISFLNDKLRSGNYKPEVILAYIRYEAISNERSKTDGKNGNSEDQR